MRITTMKLYLTLKHRFYKEKNSNSTRFCYIFCKMVQFIYLNNLFCTLLWSLKMIYFCTTGQIKGSQRCALMEYKLETKEKKVNTTILVLSQWKKVHTKSKHVWKTCYSNFCPLSYFRSSLNSITSKKN